MLFKRAAFNGKADVGQQFRLYMVSINYTPCTESIGDKKTVKINSGDAYGDKNPDMLVEFPQDQFPEDMKPEIGMRL